MPERNEGWYWQRLFRLHSTGWRWCTEDQAGKDKKYVVEAFAFFKTPGDGVYVATNKFYGDTLMAALIEALDFAELKWRTKCPYCGTRFTGPAAGKNKYHDTYCTPICAVQHESDIGIFETADNEIA